jgi:hypothetical protein
VLGGIYRVVKSVDDKVEEILDEVWEGLEASREDYFPDHYWDNNHQNGYYRSTKHFLEALRRQEALSIVAGDAPLCCLERKRNSVTHDQSDTNSFVLK